MAQASTDGDHPSTSEEALLSAEDVQNVRMNLVKAIGFNDFGWSNQPDNMQQDLTLAQCKSKFRIFQAGIPELGRS